ncbi:MAG: 50S ribosomal protein L18 [Candidatus Organicella extenuata]|jgi:ribosomal protein L18|uniref:50S ribosomal protein L18 n=1 Tax=Candidatus Organicella extenuata TaxID=2841811 RepID=A0AA51BKA1_9BACT|nr:MAG: 50S ribosomal protein L18 [Candidatus Organicella extenuata]
MLNKLNNKTVGKVVLSVFFSKKHMYAQCKKRSTHDTHTINFISTNSKRNSLIFKNTSVRNCFILGQEFGYSLFRKSIVSLVISKGKRYHGRLKAFIEGIRFFLKV